MQERAEQYEEYKWEQKRQHLRDSTSSTHYITYPSLLTGRDVKSQVMNGEMDLSERLQSQRQRLAKEQEDLKY